jgi:acetyl esterase/lipase
MFSILYYTILLVCTLGSIYIFSKNKPTKARFGFQLLMRRVNYLILLLITLGLWSYQFSLWFVPKGTPLHETLRVPFHVSDMAAYDVSEIKETTFPYGKNARQYLIWFEPANKKITQDRVIYFIHGGSWRYGNPEMYRPFAQFFTKRGYAVAITGYRLAPQFGYMEMREDLNLSMKKILEILKNKDFQNKKLLLVGDSAGANLAALLLYDRKNLNKIGVDQSIFDGLIAFAGPMNLDELDESIALKDYAGARTDSTFQLANPINYLQSDETTPILCLHGTKDGYVNYASSKTFIQRLNQINPKLGQLATFENKTHLDIIGKWLCNKNEVRIFFEKWLDEKEQVVRN